MLIANVVYIFQIYRNEFQTCYTLFEIHVKIKSIDVTNVNFALSGSLVKLVLAHKIAI